MIIEVTIQKAYKYEISVSCELGDDGVPVYKAIIADGGFISYFDHYADYSGATIEEAVSKIARSINEALIQLQSI